MPDEQLGEEAEWVMEKSAARDACLPSLPTIPSPTSAAWIIDTSLPPSPMQQTRFLVCVRISRATSAFCVGEHRHATTADSCVASSMNSS